MVVEVLKIGIQLADALNYLHLRQPPNIFRDLKPANVMIGPDAQIYLIDFGIARLFAPGKSQDTFKEQELGQHCCQVGELLTAFDLSLLKMAVGLDEEHWHRYKSRV